jgi:uncharacterized protein (TIGR00661 family)
MKRLLFLVQGEGRGHMTQAIALAQLLPGCEIRVLVGRSPQRRIPEFFTRAFPDAEGFDSLNFAFDARQRSVNQLRTVLASLPRLPRYWRALRAVRSRIRAFAPDLIVNFFEPLGSLASRGLGIPTVALGHQFLFDHPQTPFPGGLDWERRAFRTYLRFFFGHSDRLLALSAYPAPPHGRIAVVPPLLRAELFALRPTQKNFALTYVVNRGYADDIAGRWPLPTVCFWDNPDAPRRLKRANTLFHRIDDRAYLRFMAHCRCLVTTAGFESMCEAAYLGKPMVLVPVEGHFEQLCNATDAATHGLALHARTFAAVDPAVARPPKSDRDWLASAGRVIPSLLAEVAAQRPRRAVLPPHSEERAFHSGPRTS